MRVVDIDWRLCSDRYGLARFRPVAMAFEIGLFFIGSLFWIEARLQGDAFSADIYGNFALMFSAEFWAALMMAGAAITINGLVKPMHGKRVTIGSVIQFATFAGLAYSSAFTGGEFVIAVFASVMFVTPHIWLIFEGLRNDGR